MFQDSASFQNEETTISIEHADNRHKQWRDTGQEQYLTECPTTA
jgi:hypothetical protein